MVSNGTLDIRRLRESCDSSIRDRLDVAKSWLRKCSDEHQVCKHPYILGWPASWLPTRLIQIGDGDTLRLIDGKDIGRPENAQYVALSHCWGDAQLVPKTTVDNQGLRYQDIPWTDLSNTFKDAVAITKALRFSYIWIDSLCILQGNKQDFNHECAKMHFVYSYAATVICASSSMDGDGGMLKSQGYVSENSAQATSDTQEGDFEAFNHWSDLVNSGPLATRAWTYQERQLATRIVHFSDREVFWECRAGIATEKMPGMLSRGSIQFQISLFTYGSYSSTFPALRILDNPSLPKSALYERYNRWLFLVEKYSTRNLSYEGDRLPALSGLASAVLASFGGRAWEDEYMAGLWKQDILRGMLWEPRYATPLSVWTAGDQPLSTIPSWSWAACKGDVYYGSVRKWPMMDSDSKVRVDSYCPTLIGGDPFGAINGAKLSLSAPMWIVYTSTLFGRRWLHTTTDEGEHKYEIDLRDNSHITASFDSGVMNPLLDACIGSFKFVALFYYAGLIVELVDDCTFRRIGTFLRTGTFRRDRDGEMREGIDWPIMQIDLI